MTNDELNKNLFAEFFKILPKASKSSFVTDNDEILTLEAIELRRTVVIPGFSRMSVSEIVFRKFYEMKDLSDNAKEIKHLENMEVFKKIGLDEEDVFFTLQNLIKDIKELDNSKGRVIRNPF